MLPPPSAQDGICTIYRTMLGANECIKDVSLDCDDSIIDWALLDWLVGGIPSSVGSSIGIR